MTRASDTMLMPASDPLLVIRGLRTEVLTPAGPRAAVDDVGLAVHRGRTTALVGESGCGKTMVTLSVMRLLPPAARVAAGEVLLDGRNLLALSERQMADVRGRCVGLVFQEPMSAFNPVMSVGQQISEVIRRHLGLGRRAAAARAVACLEQAAVPDPQRVAEAYPHQLSGGLRQRAMIAAALAAEPSLLIADEPTTALDVTLQAQVLRLLKELAGRRGLSVLLVTHDLGVVAAVADDVAVMYAGRVVESGPVAELLARPLHPYTQGLVQCTPTLRTPRGRLPVIEGTVPPLAALPPGCRFHPRCTLGKDEPRCRAEPPAPLPAGPDRTVACWKAGTS